MGDRQEMREYRSRGLRVVRERAGGERRVTTNKEKEAIR